MIVLYLTNYINPCCVIQQCLLVSWSFHRGIGAGGQRTSMFGAYGGPEKMKDPRPLHDKAFVQQCIKQLCEVCLIFGSMFVGFRQDYKTPDNFCLYIFKGPFVGPKKGFHFVHFLHGFFFLVPGRAGLPWQRHRKGSPVTIHKRVFKDIRVHLQFSGALFSDAYC